MKQGSTTTRSGAVSTNMKGVGTTAWSRMALPHEAEQSGAHEMGQDHHMKQVRTIT